MSTQLSHEEAVRQVHHYRASLCVSRGIEPFYHSSALTPKELEELESKTIREMWIDGNGDKHVRRF